MSTATMKTPSRGKDVRLFAILVIALVIGLSGAVLDWLQTPEPKASETAPHSRFVNFQSEANDSTAKNTEETAIKVDEPFVDPNQDPNGHARQAKRLEAQQRFAQGMAMVRVRRFDDAIVAFNRVLTLLPNNTDALTNKGFALLELGEPRQAFEAFDQATNIDPAYATAYFGAAVALEKMGDLEAALGGMRSFLHTTDMGREKIYVAQARSAIWEWEAKLGRGPWGPTQGIPPGFTAEELTRDGRGVGIKMPKPETEQEDGSMDYEIRTADKIEMFER